MILLFHNLKVKDFYHVPPISQVFLCGLNNKYKTTAKVCPHAGFIYLYVFKSFDTKPT